MITRFWQSYRYYCRVAEIMKVTLSMLWSLARETGWKNRFFSPEKKQFSTGAAAVSSYRHVRYALEKLGPTFVKLGQFLSARPDLIPPELALELAKLQDKVVPLSREEVRSQLLKSFGRLPEEVFHRFDYRPLAGASIAQVHKAVLAEGRTVAVKIQRPNINRICQEDLSILRKNRHRIARSFPGRLVDIDELLEDISRKILRELDFTIEAANMDTFRRILSPYAGITVPAVHWEYTTGEILVMDYLPGVAVKDLSKEDRRRAARLLLQSLLVPIFQEGIFHGDPHPGNILFQPGGQVVWVDFGSIGRLDETFRRRMMLLLMAVARRDAGKVAELTLEWGKVVGPFNPAHLYEDTAELLDRVSCLGKKSVHLGHLMVGMMEISLTHHIRLPESFLLLGRTLLAGEGQARQLDPEVNLIEIALSLANSRLQEKIMPRVEQEDLYFQGLQYRDVLPNFYRQTEEVMANLAKGRQRLVFSHEGLGFLGRSLEKTGQFIAAGLVLGATVITFGHSLPFNEVYPWLAVFLVAGGSWLLIIGLVRLTGK